MPSRSSGPPNLAGVGLLLGIQQAARGRARRPTAAHGDARYPSSVQATDAATKQPCAIQLRTTGLAVSWRTGSRSQCVAATRNSRVASMRALLAYAKHATGAETWRPGREYRALCAATATRMAELADRNREDVARWATEAAAEFRERHDEIGVLVSAKAQTATQECAAAEAALKEAAEAVEREAQALGFKRPET